MRHFGINGLKGHLGSKKGMVAVGVVLVGAFSIFMAMDQQKIMSTLDQSSGCHFPPIYNFGDSNSDTGGRSAAFTRVPPPYGMTFFGKPSGRFSDGRLIIDFMGKSCFFFTRISLGLDQVNV